VSPPDLITARTQIENYISRARGSNRSIIEGYSRAILAEHGKWLEASVNGFEREAVAYSGTSPFVPTGEFAVTSEILRYTNYTLEGSTSVYFFNSGAIRDMPATAELVKLQSRWHQAMIAGSASRGKNLREVAQQERFAQDGERRLAQQEREKKFDTPRRRAEQCQDTTAARVRAEPSRSEMCGALLSDFDARAKGYEGSMGWLEAFIKGNSADAIRSRGTLLVNIASFVKHGQCSPAKRENRNGFDCVFSATVSYSDHEITRAVQALPGTSGIKNARGFFYIGSSGRWETDQ